MKEWIKKNIFGLAIVFSLLLHLIIFATFSLFLKYPINIPLFAETKIPEKKPPVQPMVFDLTETPEDARLDDAPKEARHVSDKNARAQNQQADKSLPIDKSYSEGDVDIPQVAEILGALAQAQQQEQQPDREKQGEAKKEPEEIGQKQPQSNFSSSQFSREMLTRGAETAENQPQGTSSLQRSAYDQRESQVPDFGSFSLNTYDWDFAPYLLRMKRKIESHIFPPAAFSRMGIISGKSQLRFRIDQDGKLMNIEVLGYDGHQSLMKTSKKAVEVSIPFDPLPDNFPKEYLEVTAVFEYRIY